MTVTLKPHEDFTLVFVMGMPGGGTSATAGTLALNEYWFGGRDKKYWEDIAAARLYYTSIWDKPKEDYWNVLQSQSEHYFNSYIAKARKAGYDRAVSKIAWHLLWQPQTMLCNEHIRPLLVSRDPQENYQSAVTRWKTVTPEIFIEGQEQIQRLHEEYGWPVWHFSKDADLGELERIMGHELPVRHFNPERVKQNVRQGH